MSGVTDEDNGTTGGPGDGSTARLKASAAGQSASGAEPIVGAGSAPIARTAASISGTDAISPEAPAGKLGGGPGPAGAGSGPGPGDSGAHRTGR